MRSPPYELAEKRGQQCRATTQANRFAGDNQQQWNQHAQAGDADLVRSRLIRAAAQQQKEFRQPGAVEDGRYRVQGLEIDIETARLPLLDNGLRAARAKIQI